MVVNHGAKYRMMFGKEELVEDWDLQCSFYKRWAGVGGVKHRAELISYQKFARVVEIT